MIVLDTHTMIWAVQDDPRLGRQARHLLEKAVDDGILVPAICAWETALLVSRGQVDLELETEGWMRRVLSRPGYKFAPLEPEIAIASVALDWGHKDPADRMIVATAQHWCAPLMTADREIKRYASRADLEVIDAAL